MNYKRLRQCPLPQLEFDFRLSYFVRIIGLTNAREFFLLLCNDSFFSSGISSFSIAINKKKGKV